MSPLVTKVRGDIPPKKSLAFAATGSEYPRQSEQISEQNLRIIPNRTFRTDIPLNETFGAPGCSSALSKDQSIFRSLIYS